MFCRACGKELPQNSKFCPHCGSGTGDTQETICVSTTERPVVLAKSGRGDKLTAEGTFQYLKNAKDLLMAAYACQQAEDKLQDTINQLGIPRTLKPPFREPLKKSEIIWMVGVWVLGSIMMQAFGIDINISSKSLGNLMLIHLLVIFFPIFRREIRHYKAKQTWRLQSEKDKERVKSECHRAELLEQQRNLIIKQQNNTYELLERLYDLDVVYPKYRSIMPIVTMYEYFESSRCHSLTGEHGAYNLYESESRQDIIISKLDDVLINLEQIKQNQYRIYREISEANMLAEEICSTAGRLAASGQSIEKNSAAAAFQAKQAAQYSAIAAYVNAFE